MKIVKHPSRNKNRSSASAIATDDTATDDNNTQFSTDTTSEINLLKQL